MSTENNICAPRLRFPNFESAWKAIKFKDIYEYASEGGTPTTSVPEYYEGGNLPFVKIADTMQKYIYETASHITESGLKHSSAWIIPADNIIFTNGATVGNVAINKIPLCTKQGILGVIVKKEEYDVEFLYYLLSSDEFQKMVHARETKGTFATIILKNLNSIDLTIPSSLAEQKKIAECLEEMDNLIAAQSQNVDALKQKKKGLMQQLFPQEGETTPRFRFPGFTGEWYDKALSECLEERNEQFPESEDYPLMAFAAGVGITPKGEKYDRSALVKDAANKKYKRTELGDFIYSSNNLESGSIGLNKYGSACISPVYSIFKSKSNIDSTFIGILLTKKSFIAQMVKFRQGVVYGQWKIPEKEFLKIHIFIPSPEEQQKIASCLSELDTIIASESAKLEALKDHKKGLMQQLFPQPAK